MMGAAYESSFALARAYDKVIRRWREEAERAKTPAQRSHERRMSAKRKRGRY